MGENIVAIFHGRVAREAGLVQRLVTRLSVLKVSEPPATCHGATDATSDRGLLTLARSPVLGHDLKWTTG